MNQESTTSQESSLFENEIIYTRASSGKRLLNLVIYIIVFYALIFILALFMVSLSPETTISFQSDDLGSFLLMNLIYSAIYALYMGAMEAVLKGKSPGKYITGTLAVNNDGTPISARTAFLRGFSRAVPFCAFSALDTPCDPWQDRWTNTMVIDQNRS
ncbi:RDD family protein [Niabella beijingensis]|uniref:RDD family protein n=1 Tax=Niabella beijingensis TaxID=2872700 RepID=UPI001CC0A216|nr:RDD family protein [Niabella beijingensis]MBZ4188687.1 RDD family protein [Niabella beijingensis]